MSDETTDSMDMCCAVVRRAVHHARRGWFDDHERRTLLAALGHGEGACVPFPDDACLIAAHKHLLSRAHRAEAERDALRADLRSVAAHARGVLASAARRGPLADTEPEPSRTGGVLGWCPTHEREDRCCDVEPSRADGDKWPEAVSDGLTIPCMRCGEIPAIDYRVDDDFWRKVARPRERKNVVCLDCLCHDHEDVAEHLEEVQVINGGVTTVLKPVQTVNHATGRHPADDRRRQGRT